MAQSHIHLRFTWQAWHKLTSTVVLRGRRGTHGTGWRAWAGLVADDAAALCVAGVAQSHIHLRFTWQAWHNLTSAFVLRGRRGTHGTGWRAWAGLVADDAAALCVAGVAQSHIHLRFTWHAWRNLTSAFVLHGRRCTHGTGWRAWAGLVADDAAALCVAGVAQSHIHLRFAWQAWHSWDWVARLGRFGRGWRRGTLRGRRGTTSHPPSFCMAGVAQSHIHLRFAWQAWHSWDWVARLGRFGRGWRRGTLRGRRGAISHPPSFHVAGVAQSHIHLRFAWQAWHLVTSTYVLRGRHGTWRHPPLFCHIPSLSHATLSHTIFHTSSLTHHLGHTIFHTTLSHTIFDTPSQTIFHTPSFIHRFVSHHLSPHHPSHTTLSHTIFYTPSQTISYTPSLTTPSFTHQLCHTPSLSIFHTTLSRTNFVTHHLSHTNFVTHHLSHTVTGHLSHTIFHTTLCLTPSFTTPSFTQICHAPTLSLTIFHTPSFTHRHRPSFTHHPSHTTLSHTIFHTQLCHTQLSHTHTPCFTQLCHTHTPDTIFLCHTPAFTYNFVTHTILFYFSILHHLLCLSFLPHPRYNMWCLLLEEIVLWGYPVL